MSADPAAGRQPVRLLQGYVWHPRELEIDLAETLPATLGSAIHVLIDAIPAAPFAFFDDGTLSASQQFYQLTVVTFRDDEEDLSGLVPWAAETLQRHLDATPEGVGWQVFEDMRDLG